MKTTSKIIIGLIIATFALSALAIILWPADQYQSSSVCTFDDTDEYDYDEYDYEDTEPIEVAETSVNADTIEIPTCKAIVITGNPYTFRYEVRDSMLVIQEISY